MSWDKSTVYHVCAGASKQIRPHIQNNLFSALQGPPGAPGAEGRQGEKGAKVRWDLKALKCLEWNSTAYVQAEIYSILCLGMHGSSCE